MFGAADTKEKNWDIISSSNFQNFNFHNFQWKNMKHTFNLN